MHLALEYEQLCRNKTTTQSFGALTVEYKRTDLVKYRHDLKLCD